MAFLALLSACRPSSPLVASAPAAPSEETRATLSNTPVVRVLVLGEGVIWRQGKAYAWERVEVTNVFGFDREPPRGETVTVLPLRHDLPSLQVTIVAAARRAEIPPVWWEVELEPITDRAYFDVAAPPDTSAEFPAEVLVLYPAVANARLVAPEALDALPAATPLATVKGAVDWTGEGRADGLWVKHCCIDRSPRACGDTCSEVYRRDAGDSEWRLVSRAEPE